MMIEDLGHAGRLREAKVMAALPEILGAAIMKKIDRFYISDGKLFLRITSAPMRNELFMLKQPILDKLNEAAGEEVIVDIVFR